MLIIAKAMECSFSKYRSRRSKRTSSARNLSIQAKERCEVNRRLVHFFVETALAASFVLLAITLVLRDVGLQAMVETGLASFLGIESAVSIEGCASDG